MEVHRAEKVVSGAPPPASLTGVSAVLEALPVTIPVTLSLRFYLAVLLEVVMEVDGRKIRRTEVGGEEEAVA